MSLSPSPLSGGGRGTQKRALEHSPRSPSISQDEGGAGGREDGTPCRPLSKPQRPVPWPIFLTVSSQDALSPAGRETGWSRMEERRRAWLHFWKHVMKLRRVGESHSLCWKFHPAPCSSLGFPFRYSPRRDLSRFSREQRGGAWKYRLSWLKVEPA